jgi:hypothetical protein
MTIIIVLLFILGPFGLTVPQVRAQVAPAPQAPLARVQAAPVARAQNAPVARRAAPMAPAGQNVVSSASSSGDGYTQLTVNGDKGDLLLVMHGDRFTAILDGEVLPPERLLREGDKLSVAGPDGAALYEMRVDTDKHSLVYPYDAAFETPDFWNGNDPFGGQAAWPGTTVWSTDNNRKLIGVTTSAVDGALRAQCGLGQEAFVIESVSADMPAGKAGMLPFDVVTAIDGQPGASTEKLRVALDARKAGDKLTLTVLRAGKSQDLELTLEEPKKRSVYSARVAPGAYAVTTGENGQAYQSLMQAQGENEKARVELLARLDAVRAETEALSAAKSGEDAKRLAELAQKQAEIADELRTREAAMRDAGNYVGVLQGDKDGGSRWLMLPRSGAAAAPADDERMARLEERLVRLEALLERLAPPANDTTKSGEASGKKP